MRNSLGGFQWSMGIHSRDGRRLTPPGFAFCVLAVVLISVVFLIAPVEAAAPSSLEGEWQQMDFLGVNQESPACVRATYKMRKIAIQRSPDQSLGGVYITYEQSFWTQHGQPNCAFSPPTMSNALAQRTRLWPFRLTSEGNGRWHLRADVANCTGDYCNEPNIKAAFETTLELNGDTLIDDGGDTQGGLRFRTATKARALGASALSALDSLMKMFDSGECNAFVAHSVTRDSPLREHQGDFCKIAQRLHSLEPPVSGSAIINSLPMDRTTSPGGYFQNVQDVLLNGSVSFQDGTTLPRAVVLRQENGVWKVYALLAQ